MVCTDMCSRNTGLFGATSSSSRRVMTSWLSSQMSSFQPSPSIHSPSGVFAAFSATASRMAWRLVTPLKSRLSICSPVHLQCMWHSTKPGVRILPVASMTLVCSPMNCWTSAAVPTAMTLPSLAATPPSSMMGKSVLPSFTSSHVMATV